MRRKCRHKLHAAAAALSQKVQQSIISSRKSAHFQLHVAPAHFGSRKGECTLLGGIRAKNAPLLALLATAPPEEYSTQTRNSPVWKNSTIKKCFQKLAGNMKQK